MAIDPSAGALSVVAEVADIQDKGEGRNAVIMLRARGTDPADRPGDAGRRRVRRPARRAPGRTGSGRALYRTEAAAPDGSNARVVLDDGVAEYAG